MTINQTPIFKLLQAAYCDIKINDNLINISPQLYTMVISDYYKVPNHLRNFFIKLSEGIDIDQFENIILTSTKDMEINPCFNCSSCQGCCKLFYAALAQDFIMENNTATSSPLKDLENFINKVREELGHCNFSPIPPSIQKHIIAKSSIYETYAKQKEKLSETRDINNSLIVLKGLSSSTPYLYNGVIHNAHFTGGGLYINWNNLGIVIDPGFGFVENMQKNKIFIEDIDIVIITHFHIDHTNDIRLLDDLNRSINHNVLDFENDYEYNKYRKFCSQKKFHKINWHVDSDTFQHLMPNLNPLINNINIVENCEFKLPVKFSETIEFTPFPTRHVQINHFDDEKISRKYKDNTFGVKLNLKTPDNDNIVFGYTSDTAFYPDLLEYLQDVACLVANISGIYEDDYLHTKYKGRHLGYAGCKKILENISPKILVVSEFWNGITDLRYDVCKDLQSYTKNRVLPGEIGLQINLLNFNIRCSICGNYSNYKKANVAAPIGQMNNISFICNDCIY